MNLILDGYSGSYKARSRPHKLLELDYFTWWHIFLGYVSSPEKVGKGEHLFYSLHFWGCYCFCFYLDWTG